METNYKKLQEQYDRLYSYFRTTCEPFDELELDGKILRVWRDGDNMEVVTADFVPIVRPVFLSDSGMGKKVVITDEE